MLYKLYLYQQVLVIDIRSMLTFIYVCKLLGLNGSKVPNYKYCVNQKRLFRDVRYTWSRVGFSCRSHCRRQWVLPLPCSFRWYQEKTWFVSFSIYTCILLETVKRRNTKNMFINKRLMGHIARLPEKYFLAKNRLVQCYDYTSRLD